jgi:hypothetical protein
VKGVCPHDLVLNGFQPALKICYNPNSVSIFIPHNKICSHVFMLVVLGGVIVSMPATGRKIHGLKLGRGDIFLRALISAVHFPSEWKYSRRPHVVRFYGM